MTSTNTQAIMKSREVKITNYDKDELDVNIYSYI